MEQERRLLEEREKERKFQERKTDLLKRMQGEKGIPPGSLGLKSAFEDGSDPDEWIRKQHGREMAERRKSLAKGAGEDSEWCKLHLPQIRLPTRPVYDIGGQHEAAMARYRQNKYEWDRRCGGPAAAEGYVDLVSDAPLGGTSANPRPSDAEPAAEAGPD